MNTSKLYNSYRIPKKRNGFRTIYDPNSSLREVQGRILSKVLSHVSIPDYIYAFEKKKSIPLMASNHVGKRLVISVDLHDFFTKITQRMIFQSMEQLGMSKDSARLVSELCTYKFFTPQGALTSPKIANIITSMTFGPEIKEYCDSNDLALTIFADDITISTNTSGNINVSQILKDITSILIKHKFSVNYLKTKVMWGKRSRQYVCGVVVNEKLNLIKKQRSTLRAIVHNICVNGLEAEAAKNDLSAGEFKSRILGKLNWFGQLNKIQGDKLKSKLNEYLESLPEIVTTGEQYESSLPSSELKDVPWDLV